MDWSLKVVLIFTVVLLLVHKGFSQQPEFHKDPNDPHGGIPMGIPSVICDDAKNNIEIDWDPQSTDEYTCTNPWKNDQPELDINLIEEEDVAKKPTHVCQSEPIHYDSDLPTSGAHRPLWPVYGEYSFIPPQRWLHSLEHGAIVLCYHPCANKDEIIMAKKIVKNCLRKHIITACKKMPPGVKFALLSWKSKFLLSSPNYSTMVSFIKSHAKKAPEGPLATDGQYSAGLTNPAEIVSDINDSVICPKNLLMEETATDILKKSKRRRKQYESSEKRLAHAVQSFMAGH